MRNTVCSVRYAKYGYTPLEIPAPDRGKEKSLTGYTLIELIIVLAIIGILAGIGTPLVLQLTDSFQYTIFRKDLSGGAGVAFARMKREVRRLADDTSVYTANAATYRFIDINGDTIQFQLNGTDLEREHNGTTDVLAANLSSLSFTYLDDGGTAINAPLLNPQSTDIKFVEINGTFAMGSNTLNYIARIKLRNVMHISDLFP